MPHENGFILLDQQYAHERILYEENLRSLQGNKKAVQRELFAQHVEFDAATATLVLSLLVKLNDLGFEIGEFGKNTFVIHGLPAGLEAGTNPIELLKATVVNYQENLEFQLGTDMNMARSLAASACMKRGKPLTVAEMKTLVDKLLPVKPHLPVLQAIRPLCIMISKTSKNNLNSSNGSIDRCG